MSHSKRMLRHGPRTGVLAASIGALIATGGVSGAAWGQDDEEESENSEGTIIVTGTRIRRDDYSAVTPTTVVTGDEMRELGVISVADMVNQLPNNIASVSPEATADSPFYLGASIANMRGLNTAFGVRTLTLIDSRRVAPTNNAGGVDMNFIPSALVGRIETVTGGASAAYGADAMAGVVNVILDDSIDNIRVDLNYSTTAEGDGDQYTLSVGTGFQFFENNRGRLTVGLDSSRQEAIEDCTTREFCRRGMGMFRNGIGGSALLHADRGTDIIYEGQPEWMLTEGHRYALTPTGVVIDGNDDPPGPGDYIADYPDPNDLAQGWYVFNNEGTELVPYLDHLDERDLAAVYSLGSQTNSAAFSGSLQGPGNRWASPHGEGRNIYADVPIRPETARDNLFARFSYELEGGITLQSSLRYGVTRSESLQNAARNNLQSFCVMPTNAYLQEEMGAGPTLRGVYDARAVGGVSGGSYDFFWDTILNVEDGCSMAPFLGGTFNDRPDELPDGEEFESNRFEFAPGLEFHKDWSTLVDRRNVNDSNALNIDLSASGTLFEGGSWTWDAYAAFGHTENRQTLSGWRAARRWDLAMDSVFDGWDTDGDGVADVAPDQPQPAGAEPVAVCSVFAENTDFVPPTGFGIPPGETVNYGDWMTARWQDYLFQATADSLSQAERDELWQTLSGDCVPLKPFGDQPLSPEVLAYTFPTLFEGTDNDQTSLSLSFSGDAWRGIGNAGPMRMAAGIDWRENDTQNLADPNRFLGADFNFVGSSRNDQGFGRIYGDNWFGRSTTEEAFVEFDLPLVQDKPGADFLSLNTSFRRTRSTSERVSGLESVQTPPRVREVDSWRAAMSWQPVDVMRVRMTRSADVRAPAARELFATNSYALETGGDTEIINAFRFNIDDGDINTEAGDNIVVIEAGNAALSPERSITETLGVVFQPVEAIPGLQVSVDYYQTTIEAGIRDIDESTTRNLCLNEIGRWETIWDQVDEDGNFTPVVDPSEQVFCQNVEFDPTPDPDMEFLVPDAVDPTTQEVILGPDGQPISEPIPNPLWEYSNIVTVAESSINEEDFVSRGIDYSISYTTQLAGGGSINGRALFTRFLEQRTFLPNTFGSLDVSGQTGGNNIANYFGTFSVNYSPTPRIRGNLYLTYRKNAFTMTAQARYTGTGQLNTQNLWLAPGDCVTYTQYSGGSPASFNPGVNTYCYDPSFERTVQDNDLPSWTTLNLNFNYDFGRSRFQLDRFESLSAYLNIENVGDRVPMFFSGTGAGGINTSLFSAMGRQYRMGVRMEF